MAVETIPIGADFDVWYNGAVPRAGGSQLTTGTCTWRLLDDTLTLVTGATGSLTGGTGGNYAGVIDAAYTALLTHGSTYYVEITFGQSGYDDKRYLDFVASRRGRT